MKNVNKVLILTGLLVLFSVPAICQSAKDYVDSGLAKYIVRKDLDGAIAEYNKALGADPTYADAYFRLGQVKDDKGDWDGAIADYTKFIELTPEDSKAFSTRADGYSHRAFSKQSKGDMDGAISDYSKSLELNPGNSTALYNRAAAKSDKGDLDGALADYSRAIELEPDNALYYNQRGLLKRKKDDNDGAIADYTKAIGLNSNDPDIYSNRAIAKKVKDDLDGAITDLSRAIELDSDNAELYWHRGCLRYDVRDFADAEADFRMLAGDDAHFRIWLIRSRIGDAKIATVDLKTYLADRKVGKPDDWPSKIGGFLTGELTEPQFLAAAKNADPKTEAEQLCDAYFYAGSKHLIAGDKIIAVSYFQRSIATNKKGFTEYDSAAAELKFQKTQKP